MPGYRLYFLDRFSGHIDRRRDFHAETDDEAIVQADASGSTQPMELWQGARKLKRWDASGPGEAQITAVIHGE
jgi:hypothetical protein